MKINFRNIIWLISILAFISACKKEEQNPLIGTWERRMQAGVKGEYLVQHTTFNEDNTGIIVQKVYNGNDELVEEESYAITWSTEGSQLTIDYIDYQESVTVQYYFVDNTLVLSGDGYSIIWIKK
jgi:hypothetical protein